LTAKNELMGARHTAIADLDNDGDKEIIYADIGASNSFTSNVYVVNHDKSTFWKSSDYSDQGFQMPMSIVDINSKVFYFIGVIKL